MADLTQTTVEWAGRTFHGSRAAGGSTLSVLDGWEGAPSSRSSFTARSRGHGWFSSPVYADGRTVTLGGLHTSPATRDAMIADLEAAFVLGVEGDLTVTHVGRTLSSAAVVTRFDIANTSLGAGVFRWTAELVCPDPLRYGPLVATSSGFPEMVGGLRFDLYTNGAGTTTGWLDYGDPSITGHLSLANVGTAPSWPQFQVAGPVDAAGFEIVTVGSGARVRFEGAVPLGSVVVIDAASGVAMIDGVADRGGLLTWRDWTPVPAGGSVEFAFVPLGTPMGAVLTASARPAYW